MIAAVAGRCDVYKLKSGEAARSPGMKYKHYAPRCKTRLFEAEEIRSAANCFEEMRRQGKRAYVLCEHNAAACFPQEFVLDLGKTDAEMASNLYSLLRRGEEVADVIVAVKPEKQDGIMAGVINRLSKACAEE